MSRDVPGNVESTVRWMLHHWMDARSIDVTVHPLSKDLSAEATHYLDSIGYGGQGEGATFHAPTALRVFRGSFISNLMAHKAMMAKDHQGSNGARPLYISEGPLERLCGRLLPFMGRLTALNLSTPKLPQLPPFKELVHLELHSIKFEGMQQSLMGLHSLETLFLSCEHLEALLPELRLQGLLQLRHVRLDDVFPAELSLPPGCRLDIKGEATVMNEVIGAAWKDAMQHLHACTCKWTITRKTGLRVVNVPSLPGFLSMAAGCIQELSLDGVGMLDFSVNRQPIRLDPAIFWNLKKLWMKSDMDIQLHIPAAVQLTSLQIYVDFLGLSFDDEMVSCANLTYVILLYHMTIGDPFDELLSEPLAKNGRHLHQRMHKQVRYWFLTCIPPVAEASVSDMDYIEMSHRDIEDFEVHLKIYQGALDRCNCKICWPCMRLGEKKLDPRL